MMNIVHALRYVALGTVVLAGAWGCATRPEPIALSQARTQYLQAQQNPQITAYAPVALREAEQPLRQAERLWAEDKDAAEVQHLAYVSERRIEIARAAAEQKLAEAEIQ